MPGDGGRTRVPEIDEEVYDVTFTDAPPIVTAGERDVPKPEPEIVIVASETVAVLIAARAGDGRTPSNASAIATEVTADPLMYLPLFITRVSTRATARERRSTSDTRHRFFARGARKLSEAATRIAHGIPLGDAPKRNRAVRDELRHSADMA